MTTQELLVAIHERFLKENKEYTNSFTKYEKDALLDQQFHYELIENYKMEEILENIPEFFQVRNWAIIKYYCSDDNPELKEIAQAWIRCCDHLSQLSYACQCNHENKYRTFYYINVDVFNNVNEK